MLEDFSYFSFVEAKGWIAEVARLETNEFFVIERRYDGRFVDVWLFDKVTVFELEGYCWLDN